MEEVEGDERGEREALVVREAEGEPVARAEGAGEREGEEVGVPRGVGVRLCRGLREPAGEKVRRALAVDERDGMGERVVLEVSVGEAGEGVGEGEGREDVLGLRVVVAAGVPLVLVLALGRVEGDFVALRHAELVAVPRGGELVALGVGRALLVILGLVEMVVEVEVEGEGRGERESVVEKEGEGEEEAWPLAVLLADALALPPGVKEGENVGKVGKAVALTLEEALAQREESGEKLGEGVVEREVHTVDDTVALPEGDVEERRLLLEHGEALTALLRVGLREIEGDGVVDAQREAEELRVGRGVRVGEPEAVRMREGVGDCVPDAERERVRVGEGEALPVTGVEAVKRGDLEVLKEAVAGEEGVTVSVEEGEGVGRGEEEREALLLAVAGKVAVGGGEAEPESVESREEEA